MGKKKKILLELQGRLWKKPCSMPIEIEEIKKEILNHCGYKESMLALEQKALLTLNL